MSEQIGKPSAEEQQAAEGQSIGVDDPLKIGVGEAQVSADRRQRDVDDGHVEHNHQLAQADDKQRKAGARIRRMVICSGGRQVSWGTHRFLDGRIGQCPRRVT